MAKSYNHKTIEKKWQKEWEKKGINKQEAKAGRPKCYVLDMFPYPSGAGLHVGHPRGYIATDIYSRFKRMTGHSILHPMGWDGFGLPAEIFAIKNKIHPKVSVKKNTKRYKEQLNAIGLNYDWSREINTTDPSYYKWTQWIFLQLYKKGLAYESYEPINWCPSCQTGLANEDLENGLCERCGSEVEKKPMRQWVLRITKYADRLLKDLDKLAWPESVKEAQRNWIGRSEGALIKFPLIDVKNQKAGKHFVEIFTTRPDTIFGATYIAISPELAKKWLDLGWQTDKKIKSYIDHTLKERIKKGYQDNLVKTGIDSGLQAINPANKKKIPVWITNYVLGDVGTGAIMAVPAHDERDHDFAQKYNLPILSVLESSSERTEGEDAVRKDKPFVERNATIVIIKHWSEDKFLCSKYKKTNWQGFVIGGIEKGESIKEAALREVAEETGYTSGKFIKEVGRLHSTFFHKVKDVNRIGHFQVVYVELQNGNRTEMAQEEKDLHDVVWIPRKEVPTFLNRDDLQLAWEPFNKGYFCYTGEGILINSENFNNRKSHELKKEITKFFGGQWTTTYRLKDWVFSRQRYWGEPIPIIHCAKCGVVPVLEKDLPVKLPAVKAYAPTGTGESPLADITKWVNVKCPKCGGPGKRETNTMPQWAGSSWYYLRYIDPKNSRALVDKKKEKYWSPVDMYVGGTEHVARHMIYARFWHKFLYDIRAVNYSEPFSHYRYQGLILASDGRKMSKRWGNVINPDEVIKNYGADTLRVYEMFMGPFNQTVAWSTESMIGSRRFLEKVWRLKEKISSTKNYQSKNSSLVHKTIKKVSDDIESFSFNTAISTLMILVNAFEKESQIPQKDYQILLQLLTPFAPHITEELWQEIGHKTTKSIHLSAWPEYDPKKVLEEEVTIVIQINGKVRDSFKVIPDLTEDEIKKVALGRETIKKWLKDNKVKKVIYVKNRLINIVI